jgi:predicted protein tyrosine phosphatase
MEYDSDSSDSEYVPLYYNYCKIMSEIISDKLFLNDKYVVNDLSMLQQTGITHIISIGGYEDHTEYALHDDFDYLFVYIDDHASESIHKHFDQCNEFIDQSERVLVHCYAGISRSASIVIAYMMWKHQMPYYDAKNLVRSKRPIICPNLGFQEQLLSYEKFLTE